MTGERGGRTLGSRLPPAARGGVFRVVHEPNLHSGRVPLREPTGGRLPLRRGRLWRAVAAAVAAVAAPPPFPAVALVLVVDLVVRFAPDVAARAARRHRLLSLRVAARVGVGVAHRGGAPPPRVAAGLPCRALDVPRVGRHRATAHALTGWAAEQPVRLVALRGGQPLVLLVAARRLLHHLDPRQRQRALAQPHGGARLLVQRVE